MDDEAVDRMIEESSITHDDIDEEVDSDSVASIHDEVDEEIDTFDYEN